MPADRAFFDTNILVYAFSGDDHRREIALRLLMRGGTVGVQALNEFVNVHRSKLQKSWPDVLDRLQVIHELCPPPVPLTSAVHRRALEIAQTSGYHIYDALMLAAALEASCTVFYSEDMGDGHEIGGMKIRNPFR